MIFKHIGADGRTRQTFTDVSSVHQHQGNSIVSVNRTRMYVQTEGGLPTPGSHRLRPATAADVDMTSWSMEYPLSLINLAPGESVERVDDEPERS